MAWAKMFDVALRTALCKVAETMGGRAILTLVLELVLVPERCLNSPVRTRFWFGLVRFVLFDWMQGVHKSLLSASVAPARRSS